MKKALQIGGIAAGLVLIGFGVAATVLGIKGGNTVNSNLSQEFITGTPDMTPSGIEPEVKAIQGEQQKIAAEQKKANVPASTFTTVEAPSCSVAGEPVDDGDSALCFGKYMRIHALGASSGLTYSQMGRYAAKPDAPVQSTDFNGGTNDPSPRRPTPRPDSPFLTGRATSGSPRRRSRQRSTSPTRAAKSPCSGSSLASPYCSAASASSSWL